MVGWGLEGVEFIVANTDLQALRTNRAQSKIQIGSQSDERARRRRRPQRRPVRGARRHRAHHSSARRRRHGVRDHRAWRRHGHRRGAGHRQPGERARCADDRGRHQAVQVRRQEAAAASGAGARSAARLRRLHHHDPQRAPARDYRPHDVVDRGVRHRGRSAASGDSGHFGSDPRARPHQPRLLRRQDDHVGHGPGDDGNRRRRRTGSRD